MEQQDCTSTICQLTVLTKPAVHTYPVAGLTAGTLRRSFSQNRVAIGLGGEMGIPQWPSESPHLQNIRREHQREKEKRTTRLRSSTC